MQQIVSLNPDPIRLRISDAEVVATPTHALGLHHMKDTILEGIVDPAEIILPVRAVRAVGDIALIHTLVRGRTVGIPNHDIAAVIAEVDLIVVVDLEVRMKSD